MPTFFPRQWYLRLLLLGSGLLMLSTAAYADLHVTGGSSLVGFDTDMGCTDLVVEGTVEMQNGHFYNVRNLIITPGGSLSMQGGSITLAGDWNNHGNFSAGGGAVNFVDDVACAVPPVFSSISGNTSFDTLRITSHSGKLYQFAAGSMQTVTSSLILNGAAGRPVRIESSTPLMVSADIRLLAGGMQQTSHLAVRGMQASGQWIAAGQSNEGIGSVRGWFGAGNNAVLVPAISPWALIGMALGLLMLGGRRRFQR